LEPGLVQINAAKCNAWSALYSGVLQVKLLHMKLMETRMHWSTPTLVEICIGLEINGYLPAEF
jgi:coenzyme PQQ precursor peptide PqqA